MLPKQTGGSTASSSSCHGPSTRTRQRLVGSEQLPSLHDPQGAPSHHPSTVAGVSDEAVRRRRRQAMKGGDAHRVQQQQQPWGSESPHRPRHLDGRLRSQPRHASLVSALVLLCLVGQVAGAAFREAPDAFVGKACASDGDCTANMYCDTSTRTCTCFVGWGCTGPPNCLTTKVSVFMLVYFSLLEVLNAVALFFHAVVFYHDIVRAPKKTQQLLGPQTAVGGLARLASHKAFYLGTSLLSQLLRLAGIGFNLAYSAGAGKIRRDTFVPLGAHPIVEALYATTIYLCTASIGIIWINTAVSAGLWRSARYDLTVNNQLAWLTGTAVVLFLVLFIGVYKMLFWMAGLWALTQAVFTVVVFNVAVTAILPDHTSLIAILCRSLGGSTRSRWTVYGPFDPRTAVVPLLSAPAASPRASVGAGGSGKLPGLPRDLSSKLPSPTTTTAKEEAAVRQAEAHLAGELLMEKISMQQMIWRGKSKLNVLMDLTQQPDHRQRHQQQEQPARQSTISLDRELDGLAIIHVATTSSSNTNEIQSPSRREDYASPDRRPNAAEGGGSLLLAASVCAAGNPQQEQAATDGRHHEETETGAPRADAEPLMMGPNGSTAEQAKPRVGGRGVNMEELRAIRSAKVYESVITLAANVIVCYSCAAVFLLLFALFVNSNTLAPIAHVSLGASTACYSTAQLLALRQTSTWLRQHWRVCRTDIEVSNSKMREAMIAMRKRRG